MIFWNYEEYVIIKIMEYICFGWICFKDYYDLRGEENILFRSLNKVNLVDSCENWMKVGNMNVKYWILFFWNYLWGREYVI